MNGESFGTFKTACVCVLGLTWYALAAPLHADSLGSVTVTAPQDREKLKDDVDTFVSSTIVRSDGESLLRWDRKMKMCPLVAGLSREAGEFVLTRLSQIAMSAHAPLGSATCKPNLFVLVANESAIVVVDPVQVSKLNIGQLADYIGLVGLAEINLDKDLGEAPSILKVFAASEMAPQPLEMTTWDKALLQALYATSQDNRLQLSKIKRETLELIAAK